MSGYPTQPAMQPPHSYPVSTPPPSSYNPYAKIPPNPTQQLNLNSGPAVSIESKEKSEKTPEKKSMSSMMDLTDIVEEIKEKKEIQWLGLPTNTAQECRKLTQERNKRAERIKLKTQQLHDLLLQVTVLYDTSR